MTTFWYFTDDAARLASDDAEARDDHISGYDGAVEDADVVFNDGELADNDALADMYVASDGGGLDYGTFTDENVIAQSEREEGKGSLVYTARRAKTASLAEVTITADSDGGVAPGRRGTGARGRLGGPGEVASYHGFGLNDGLATQHNVLGSNQDGPPRHLVSCVRLYILAFDRFPRHFD